MNKTYKIIKRGFIIPFLVITILGTSLYASYMQPTTVSAMIITGNPFIDFFVNALMFTGYSLTSKDDAENTSRNFANYWSWFMYRYNAHIDALYDKGYEDWKQDIAAKYGEEWNDLSSFEKILRVDNDYTKAKFKELTGEDWKTATGFKHYNEWLKKNFVEENPFDVVKDLEVESIPLNVRVAKLVEDGVVESHYSVEQWINTTGAFSCLVMLVKDWLYYVSTTIYGNAVDLFNTVIGNVSTFYNVTGSDWYKFFNSVEIDDYINNYINKPTGLGYNSTIATYFIDAKNSFLKDFTTTYAKNFKNIGSKYVFMMRFAVNRNKGYVNFYLLDVPENIVSIKPILKYGYLYGYDFIADDGSVVDLHYNGYCIYNYATSDGTGKYLYDDQYEFYFNAKFDFRKLSGVYDNGRYNLIIPFSMKEVAIDAGSWSYGDDDEINVYNIDTGVYSNDSTTFDIEKTNSDKSDAFPGTNIDTDDVNVLPTDTVIDNAKDITDDKAKDIDNTLDKTIADAIDNAKDDTKTDAKDDTDTDTKEDIKTDVNVPDDMKDYTPKLIDLFPFCIPFDIYRFLKCLAADPEAPVIDFPLITENSFGIPPFTLHLDFSKFDSVAKVLRTMELLGFCVGLAFVTNNLIKH